MRREEGEGREEEGGTNRIGRGKWKARPRAGEKLSAVCDGRLQINLGKGLKVQSVKGSVCVCRMCHVFCVSVDMNTYRT